MAPLISKPGLTSASTLSIPTAWSSSWFRSLIASQLSGADVRNAVGANGIVVSGNITSPYATISIGGSGPVVLPNLVIDFSVNPAIQINSKAAGAGEDIEFVAFSATSKQSYMAWYESDGATRRAYLGFGDTDDELFIINSDAATGSIVLNTKATTRATISSVGGVSINAPDSGVAFTVTGVAAAVETALIQGSSTAGSSYGLLIEAGTNSSDYSVAVRNAAGTSLFFEVRGDGAIGFHGATPAAQSTGWGTPTGATKVSSFPGASATLVQCSEVIAQIITDLKSLGLYGA